jgi:hypothetical protein
VLAYRSCVFCPILCSESARQQGAKSPSFLGADTCHFHTVRPVDVRMGTP